MRIGHRSIVKDGLVFNVDAKNERCVYRDKNLLPTDTWEEGYGNPSGWSRNGFEAENFRRMATDPYNRTGLIWECISDSGGNASGGWNSSYSIIDPTKPYRLSVWFKGDLGPSGFGSSYLGTSAIGFPATSGVRKTTAQLGTTEGNNPYNVVVPLTNLNDNEWYLSIGYIFPFDYPVQTEYEPLTGIWDLNGNKVGNGVDYAMVEGCDLIRHRAYLYYASDGAKQQLTYPRMEIVDGNEPSLDSLLSGEFRNVYNSSDRTKTPYKIYNHIKLDGTTPNDNSLKFNGHSGYIQTDTLNTVLADGQWTLEIKFKTNKTPAGGLTDDIQNLTSSNFNVIPKYLSVFSQSIGVWDFGSPATWHRGDTILEVGTVYHMALICDGDQFSVYLDGVLDSTWPPFTLADQRLVIDTLGAFRHGGGRFLDGNIYYIRAYNRVLSVAEINHNREVSS